MAEYTLGSLFDGAGGFPLAGVMCGCQNRVNVKAKQKGENNE